MMRQKRSLKPLFDRKHVIFFFSLNRIYNIIRAPKWVTDPSIFKVRGKHTYHSYQQQNLSFAFIKKKKNVLWFHYIFSIFLIARKTHKWTACERKIMIDEDVIIILNLNNCGELRARSRSQRNLFSVLSSFSQQV